MWAVGQFPPLHWLVVVNTPPSSDLSSASERRSALLSFHCWQAGLPCLIEGLYLFANLDKQDSRGLCATAGEKLFARQVATFISVGQDVWG